MFYKSNIIYNKIKALIHFVNLDNKFGKKLSSSQLTLRTYLWLFYFMCHKKIAPFSHMRNTKQSFVIYESEILTRRICIYS